MATLAPLGYIQVFDNNGDPLSNGKIYTYEAGTSTPKVTYKNAAEDSLNTNPIILDAAGRCDMWLGDGGYDFVYKDADDNTIDNAYNIGGSSSTAFGGNTNSIIANTLINSVYKNSANFCSGSITLSLIPAADAGEGFYFSVQNIGGSNVTIDPDASETIDTAPTKTVKPGHGCIVISDGTEWKTLFLTDVSTTGTHNWSGTNTWNSDSNFQGKVNLVDDGELTISSGAISPTGAKHTIDTEGDAASDDLDTINNGFNGQLLILRTADDSRDVVITSAGNIITPNNGKVTLSSTSQTATLQYDLALTKWLFVSLSPSPLLDANKGKILNGLTLTNNSGDATNDIDIAAGSCVSDDGTSLITLSAITKRLDASWAVGSGNGGLDTGSIANATYHLWAILRPDTGVTDVLFSTSATSPTMPTNYTKKKLIGSIIRSGGAILPFAQDGNRFRLKTYVLDINVTNPGTSAVSRTLSVPANTIADITIRSQNNASAAYFVLVTALDEVDTTPSENYADHVGPSGASPNSMYTTKQVKADSSSQVRSRQSISASTDEFAIITRGWIDTRI